METDSVSVRGPTTELWLHVISDVLRSRAHLSDHSVPDASDQLAVLAVGDQVQVVGKLDVAGQLFQDVYAEAFTAQLGVRLRVAYNAEKKETEIHLDSFLIDFHTDQLGLIQMMPLNCLSIESKSNLHWRQCEILTNNEMLSSLWDKFSRSNNLDGPLIKNLMDPQKS